MEPPQQQQPIVPSDAPIGVPLSSASNSTQPQSAILRFRFINYIIDYYLERFMFAFLLIIILLPSVFILLSAKISVKTIPEPIIFIFVTFVMLGNMFLYYFLQEFRNGKTFGKYVSGTKVVMEDGTAVTRKAAFIRTLSRIIPFDAFSGLFREGIFWHDSLAHTRVIKDTAPVAKWRKTAVLVVFFALLTLSAVLTIFRPNG